jgi:hypothetical protein
MKVLSLMLIIIVAVASGCRMDSGKNSVDLQQIETDDSNDYKYIFRDAIQEQEHKLNKYKKKDF